MIQVIGLTSQLRRHQLKPTVEDLTFEARPGRVTVLLGPEGSGKTTALRLMLQLQSGRGTALFRGRPVQRIQHLAREVGVLLGEVNGHPGRTVRGHLRMLAASAGVPAGRADDVLDVVGLSGLADQRLSALSRGMDRRLGVACALIGDPHTLVLDEPAQELSPRETAWMYSLLRGYAGQGGTVLVTSHRSEEVAKLADRVVSIGSGRLIADQEAADYARTRLRPRVAVRTPHVDRLVAVLTQEGRRAGNARDGGPLKVVHEGGTKVSVYGSSCAEVGEHAYKNGILVHQLTDEEGDAGDVHRPGPLHRADGRQPAPESHAAALDPDTEPDSQQVSASVGEAPGPDADGGKDPDPARDSGPVRPGSEDGADEAADSESEDVLRALEELQEFDDLNVSPGRVRHSEPAGIEDDFGPHAFDPNRRSALRNWGRAASAEKPSLAVASTRGKSAVDGDSGQATQGSESGSESQLGPEHTHGAKADTADAPALASNHVSATGPASDSDSPSESVSSASAMASDATSPAPPTSEDPTIRISDGPLTDSSSGFASESPNGSATTNERATTNEPATTNALGVSSASRPVVMKPLADPDAHRNVPGDDDPLWTPKRFTARAAAELPPQLHALARPGPAAPLRYEMCRLFSLRSTWIAAAATVAVAVCVSLLMAGTRLGVPLSAGNSPSLTPAVRILTGWPSGDVFLLPPVALASGLLGALAFGEEFRYPALAPGRSPVPRRLSLLAAKLAVSAVFAVLLSLTVAIVNAVGVTLFFGEGALALPSQGDPSAAGGSWQLSLAAVFAFTAGCAWAGVLSAGIFRSGTVGAAVVVAVPLLLAPVVRSLIGDGFAQGRSIEGLPGRLESALLVPWPPGTERGIAALLNMASQPTGFALVLLLMALLAGYLVTALTGRST